MDGHDFKKGSCASCGVGRAAYDNLKSKCRNFIDKRALYHQRLDTYLDSGGDPEFIIISQKHLKKLMEAKK